MKIRYKPRKGDVFTRGRQYRGAASEAGSIKVLTVGKKTVRFKAGYSKFTMAKDIFIRQAKNTLELGAELERKKVGR